jgi:hypothetical protein
MNATVNTTQAANWLMLQGTEPWHGARANVWGFVQLDYQADTSEPNATGGYSAQTAWPDLNTQHAFNVSRARIGVRGGTATGRQGELSFCWRAGTTVLPRSTAAR